MLTMLRHGQVPGFTSACWAATGRSLIAHLIARCDPKTIILPDYAPEGVTVPVQKSGVPVRFYGLGDDLQAVPDRMHPLLDTADRPLMILIHNFGFPQTFAGTIAHYTKQKGGFVLEDCAQALLGSASEVRHGDFALYSINKWLPVVDGAMLKSRRPEVDVGAPAIEPLPTRAVRAYSEHLGWNATTAGAADTLAARSYGRSSELSYMDYYAVVRDLLMLRQPIEGRAALDRMDARAMSRVRIDNAAWLYRHMPHSVRWRMPPVNAVPWCYPILLDDAQTADELAAALLERGIVASRQCDLWSRGDSSFPARHLLLPIGEGCTLEHLQTMVRTVRKIGL